MLAKGLGLAIRQESGKVFPFGGGATVYLHSTPAQPRPDHPQKVYMADYAKIYLKLQVSRCSILTIRMPDMCMQLSCGQTATPDAACCTGPSINVTLTFKPPPSLVPRPFFAGKEKTSWYNLLAHAQYIPTSGRSILSRAKARARARARLSLVYMYILSK